MAVAASNSQPRKTHSKDDPVEWARHYWRKLGLGDSEEAFLAMSSVLRFHRLMLETVETQLRPIGLNLTDYMLLMTLELSESGTRLISQLAKSLMVHPTTATLATDRSEGRGLLKRTPHPTDRRAIEVTITDEGRELVLAATEQLSTVDFGLLNTSRKDRAALVTLLTRMRDAAGD